MNNINADSFTLFNRRIASFLVDRHVNSPCVARVTHEAPSQFRTARIIRQRRSVSRTTVLFWKLLGAVSLLIAMSSPGIHQCFGSDERVAVITGTVIGFADKTLAHEISDLDEGRPLAGALVRVAIPATDMRFVRTRPEHRRFETTTDAAGRYTLLVPVREPNTSASLDAFAPGFGSFAGSYMLGGQSTEVHLNPASTARFCFKLSKALYVAGLVVDSEGKPVAGVVITALMTQPDGYGYITEVRTGAEGKFEIFDFPPADFMAGRGEVHFEHPSFRRTELEDVYELSEAERTTLRVVVESGRTVKGRVLTEDDEPAAGVMVEANSDSQKERKAVITDGKGEFILRGLPQGRSTLVAHAIDRGEKVKLTLELTRDYDGVQLQLKALPATQIGPSVHILGMELVDLNKELSDLYDVSLRSGVLVLNPGKDHPRLNIGNLMRGDCFCLVSETKVATVSEFVDALLCNVDHRQDGGSTCRVAYVFRRVDSTGTNTQHIELTTGDLKELEQVRARLEAQDQMRPVTRQHDDGPGACRDASQGIGDQHRSGGAEGGRHAEREDEGAE